MLGQNRQPANQANYTYYPLSYLAKKQPYGYRYDYNERGIAGYVEQVDVKSQAAPTQRSYHIITGEETSHDVLRRVRNGNKPYSRRISIDASKPRTMAGIEGWTDSDQGRERVVHAFGETEIPKTTTDGGVQTVIDNLKLSVLALGLTMAQLDLARPSIATPRPMRGQLILPTDADDVNHYFTTEIKSPLYNPDRLMIVACLGSLPIAMAKWLVSINREN